MSICKLFCHVDDFFQWLVARENAKLLGVTRKRGPAPRLSLSESVTILIHFHQSHYRDFKAYYTRHVCEHMRSEFPTLVSHTRFVELIPSVLPAMCLYQRVRRIVAGPDPTRAGTRRHHVHQAACPQR